MSARFPVSPSPSCFHFPDYFLRINTRCPPVSSCLSGIFSFLLVLYMSQCVLYLYVSQFPLLDAAFFLSAFCLNPSVDGSPVFGSATQHSGCFSCRGAFHKSQLQWILLLIRSRVHGGFDDGGLAMCLLGKASQTVSLPLPPCFTAGVRIFSCCICFMPNMSSVLVSR